MKESLSKRVYELVSEIKAKTNALFPVLCHEELRLLTSNDPIKKDASQMCPAAWVKH